MLYHPESFYYQGIQSYVHLATTVGLNVSIALTYILNSQWAMTEEALRTILSLADRQSDFETLEKLQGQRPKSIQSASIRSGVGIIPIRGPLFKRANLMTEHCGATSYETVLKDFHQMLESPAVQSIVLDIDSPGGEANGCSELADHIFQARGQKPISAYIGGTGASAAYWIASACDQIFASDSAIVGSIGVQSAMRSDKSEGEIRFVSSQSPNKNRDPATEEGAKEVQTVIDGLAEVFVQKVARNRGVGREQVLSRFGQGSVFVGAEARGRNMVDDISTLESVIAKHGEKSMTTEITASFIAEKHPAVAEHFIQLGLQKGRETAKSEVEAERKRISTIRLLAQGEVPDEFCQSLIDSGTSAQDAAVAILLEVKKTGRPAAKPAVDPRFALDRTLSGIDVPPRPAVRDSELAAQQDEAIERAKKIGLRFL